MSSPPLDPLMAAYTTKRRPSRSEASGQLPPRSVSPQPSAGFHSAQPASTSSSSSSVSASLSSVQHAAGSWWKRASASANALYQQAAQQLADEPAPASGHKRSHSRRNSAASPDTLSAPQTSAAAPAYPTISSSATAHTSTSASPPQSGTQSSFFSSVLSSVSAAVSNVSAAAATVPFPSSSSSALSATATSHDPGSDGETGGAEPGFVELDLLDKMFEHPNAYINAAPPTTASPASAAPPANTTVDQSPLALSVARMSLLASVLSTDPGGYLSPDVFFTRASLLVPSLRLPALPQKLSALERFDELLEETERRTAGGRVSKEGQLQQDDVERWHNSLTAVLAGCHKLQNELAFSLSSIKESHAAATTAADGEAETVTVDDTISSAEPNAAFFTATHPTAAAASSSSSTSHHTHGLSVDKLSSRVKAFGYSVAKTAHRISKQVLQDKVSREQADVYASLVHRIARHMRSMQQRYAEASASADDKELHARVSELGVFVCEVLVVFIADDLQRAIAVYAQQEQEALSRGHAHAHIVQQEAEARRRKVSQPKQQEGAATAAYAEKAEAPATATTMYAEMLAQPPTEQPADSTSTSTSIAAPATT